jgi:hypothetical protein
MMRYLHKRRIPVEIAKKFCKEIDYDCMAKIVMQAAKNNAGDYEVHNLRSPYLPVHKEL